MRLASLAALLCLLAGCNDEAPILLVLDGDLRPGPDMGAVDVEVLQGGGQVWSSSFTFSPGQALPQSYRIPAVLDGTAIVDVRVAARQGGTVVAEATREIAYSRRQQVEVRICLWSFCSGSESAECREGRCELSPPGGDGDADSDADMDDGGGDGDGDVGTDGDVGPEGGPLTFAISTYTATLDRFCDIDGDGDLDNSVADLGSPWASFWTEAVNAQTRIAIDSGDLRLIAHIPWAEDLSTLSDSQVSFILAEGDDLEDPDDPSDDFSGSEEFYAVAPSLDPCGEPIFALPSGWLSAGSLVADGGTALMARGTNIYTAHGSRVEGTVSTGGDSIELRLCGYVTIEELGSAGEIVDGHLILEWFVAGQTTGLPGFPSTRPDIDVDGDGLEELILDADGFLSHCVDGSGVMRSGRNCWQDASMADGFSIVGTMRGSRARFESREPGWETLVEGTCDDPPADSLWTPR